MRIAHYEDRGAAVGLPLRGVGPIIRCMTVRGLLRVLLVAALAVLAVPAFFFGRAMLFPPTFDVPSIAKAPAYQDPALLEQAWRLPVAAAFAGRVSPQRNGSLCGPASVANIDRSLGGAAVSEAQVLSGTGKCRLFGFCVAGLTLDEVAEVARHASGKDVRVLRELTPAAFRALLPSFNDPGRRYLVNFHRGMLFGRGVGHHSPIGGYLAERDLVFVLDVNDHYRPWLVSTDRLFSAIDTVDSSSGKKRGLLELR